MNEERPDAPWNVTQPGLTERQELTRVARGETAADLVVKEARVINVFSGSIDRANVAVKGSRIAYVGPDVPVVDSATNVIDADGRYLSPGWIEPHAHPWVLYNPVSLMEGVIPRGTTTVFNDNLFFYLIGGADSVLEMMDDLTDWPLRLFWFVRLVSQSVDPDEDDLFSLDNLNRLFNHRRVAGSAELSRWTLALEGEETTLNKFAELKRAGSRVEGHTAGASYRKLNAIAAAGVTSCHEPITPEQVKERIRLGIWTMLRNSSLRPDVPELIKAVTEQNLSTRYLMLTSDGPGPGFINERGFLDEALRQVVKAGVSPVEAIRMVTLTPATYFRMDDTLGSVAPGRLADLLLLDDLESFRPSRVFVGGREAAADGRLTESLPVVDWDRYDFRATCQPKLFSTIRSAFDSLQAGESLPVIQYVSNVITRSNGRAEWPGTEDTNELPEGCLLGVLIDRSGEWYTRAWIEDLAPELPAMATTFTTCGELLVLGRNQAAMRRCAKQVAEMEGGFSVLSPSGEEWTETLPVCGMMTTGPFADAVELHQRIHLIVVEAGFPYKDILYALLFLTGDFLPNLRMTPSGIYNVKQQSVVEPSIATGS